MTPVIAKSSPTWLPRVDVGPVAIATVAAITLGLAYLLAPLMGADLSAQFARADFSGAHPFTPVDLRWFGGTLPFGYSLWTPALMSVLGVRTTSVIAEVASVALFTRLVRRAGSPRAAWAGTAAALTLTSNLVEGRVTFACGVAFGLAALDRLTSSLSPINRRTLAALAAVIAGAASPVATLCLLVVAVALTLRRRFADAAALSASVLPLAIISGVFADGGRQLFGTNDAVRALLASALVLALVPGRQRSVRLGALIGLAMVIFAITAPTPIGSNSTRLSLLFAVPVATAFVRGPRLLVALALATIVVVQPPIVFGTLTGAGAAATRAGYYRPLLAELSARGALTGRVEVPEIIGHWDSVYLARHVPLARGWLRQLDTELNDDVFYDALPNPDSYRGFLDRNAVQYVAVADARASFYGRREKSLLATDLDYLSVVWTSPHWTLYVVDRAVPIVAAPARLLRYQADRIVVSAPAGVDVAIRVRWLRWLRIDGPGGACLRRNGDQVVLHANLPGTYRISSSLTSVGPRC